ncbi:ATP synthase subunit epsilon [Thalassovita mediterranea]|jgi:F-type H+-transporting ATPase subunit epsilon|uniref:ATP synthase epsilon chain n=1 Tax=Thalassovita mediterranea TaxID=340021 RepID=A0A0P1GPL5_9RHOB|nr:ATP synthase subunit epsilon [Thalassovita mediterranea]MCG7572424.1 F0F1 ATP synthase subunit epsilon [Phaeobacter sp. CNT1-3]CUH84519.1 F-ATPase epsilon subunit [Thalassovita mediterranea]SIS34363.1 ATP synthase F1 subcomplex epsilon subunit [Thalassovita mediterranea]
MADTVQFDLVSPERKLASLAAEQVQIPGASGDLTAMAGHEPTILTLRPGLVIAGEESYFVTGGFAELSSDSISVLAEMAVPKAEVTQDIVTDLLSKAKAAHEAADVDNHHETHKLVADLMHIAEDMGFHTNL